MKTLKTSIQEKLKLNKDINIEVNINELTALLKNTVLKDINLHEKDFEEIEDGVFNLCNVPEDSKLAEEFFKGRSKISKAAVHTEDSESNKTITVIQPNKKDLFVRINLNTENRPGYKKGDILSIDMSKEIKDELILI